MGCLRTTFCQIQVIPDNLLSAMWLMFAQCIEGNRQHRACKECGNWLEMSAQDSGFHVSRVFCSDLCKSCGLGHRLRRGELPGSRLASQMPNQTLQTDRGPYCVSESFSSASAAAAELYRSAARRISDGHYERIVRREPDYDRRDIGRWFHDESQEVLRMESETLDDNVGMYSSWCVLSVRTCEDSNCILVLRWLALASRNLPVLFYRVHCVTERAGTKDSPNKTLEHSRHAN